ncbi:hypothetical protein N665_1123s0002 [Sinapis alba]|nr:hypothetical protein N665_1123s0002 [Sinapis alba]
MTGVSFHETTKAIRMDDEWWNDRIQEIPDAANLRAHPLTDLDRLDRLFGGKHISTDDGYYPGSGVDQNTKSETVTENEHDIVNLEDDPDVPSRNQNKYQLPSTRVPNRCTETLRVVHLQHVNEEQQRLHMTS